MWQIFCSQHIRIYLHPRSKNDLIRSCSEIKYSVQVGILWKSKKYVMIMKFSNMISDGKTGELRIDPKDKSPHDLLTKITTVIETKSGKKIQSTRTSLEFIESDENKS